MKKVFVDTSGWLAVLLSSDFHHQRAIEYYRKMLASGHDLVTHDGILLELGNALSGLQTRNIVLNLIQKIFSSQKIELIPLTSELLDSGWKLYSERPDKEWGIVDCISFELMKRLNISEALTADRHFEQAGFTKLL